MRRIGRRYRLIRTLVAGSVAVFGALTFGGERSADATVVGVGMGAQGTPGMEFDVLSGTFRASCVDGSIGYEGSPQSTVHFDSPLSFDDLRLRLDAAADADRPFSGAWNGETRRYLAKTKPTATSDTVVFSYELRGRFAALGNRGLSSFGASVAGQPPDAVRRACGDEFVGRIELGGAVYFAFRFDFASAADKLAFEKDTDLGGASLDNMVAKLVRVKYLYGSKVALSVHALQIGGDPTRMPNLTGSTPSNPVGSYFRCSFDALDACADAATAMHNYMISPAGFRAQLGAIEWNSKSTFGPAIVSYDVQPYASGGFPRLYALASRPIPPEVASSRRALLDREGSLFSDRTALDATLDGSGGTPTLDWSSASEAVDFDLAFTRQSIVQCSRTPNDCAQIERDLRTRFLKSYVVPVLTDQW